HQAGIDQRLAGYAAVWVVAQHRIQNPVGDLVGDLVRVAFRDGLGGEQVLVVGSAAHGICRNSSALVCDSCLIDVRPIDLIIRRSGISALKRGPWTSPVRSPRPRSRLKSRKS